MYLIFLGLKMETQPVFSIVIPTYKRHDKLKKCLEALRLQIPDKTTFEVIIINDDPHRGASAARNRGIRQARGEIVIFLDDDSEISSGWVKAVVRSWQDFKDADAIGGYVVTDPADTFCSRVNAGIFNWYQDQMQDGGYAQFLCTCNAGFRKKALQIAGGFDETFPGAYGEDRDLSIRILGAGGKMKAVKDITIYHDRHLEMSGFLRRHFCYGKGAFAVYSKHPQLRRLPWHSYIEFYRTIMAGSGNYLEKIRVFFLLTLSQLSTVIGYGAAILGVK